MKPFKFLIFLSILTIQSCKTQTNKINGISFVASRDTINTVHVEPVINVNANYAAIMPFGFIRDLKNPEIMFNSNRQWFGETSVGAKQYIEALQNEDIKIMVKPQIWVRGGDFTGFIKMDNEADWSILESSYSKFILEYAELAQETKADILCIGTELETFIDNRPNYWKQLIELIKKVYKGKLTYAANWDEYHRTPFWGQLDYIGIDAYFPLSEEKTPSLQACLEAWKPHKNKIETFSKTLRKPILFTEFGYRSVDYNAKKPWDFDRNMIQVNLEAQTNATQSLFDAFWNEVWFAGGFIWKWFHDHGKVGGHDNNQFTPQNKPVELLIKGYYSKK